MEAIDMTRVRRWRLAGPVALVAALALLGAPAGAVPVVHAEATIVVTTVDREINNDGDCSLQEAIYSANRDAATAPDPSNPAATINTGCVAGSGTDTIELPPAGVFTFADPIDDAANFMGPTVTPIITSPIIIEGRGALLERLEAGRLTRAFAVGPTGNLDLREVHVKGFSIRGGDGGPGGGGGGMGAGGAIFVQGGTLLVQWSTFEGNTVRGGDGGSDRADAAGGGGGIFGDGGGGTHSGGGGGGARGDGGDARADRRATSGAAAGVAG